MTVEEIIKEIKRDDGPWHRAYSRAWNGLNPQFGEGPRFGLAFNAGWNSAIETMEMLAEKPQHPQGGWASGPKESTVKCGDCWYWTGLCHRYPGGPNKDSSDWCGEYTEIKP